MLNRIEIMKIMIQKRFVKIYSWFWNKNITNQFIYNIKHDEVSSYLSTTPFHLFLTQRTTFLYPQRYILQTKILKYAIINKTSNQDSNS